MKETCKKIYGCEHPSQSAEVKEKMKETCKKIYGYEHPSQSRD